MTSEVTKIKTLMESLQKEVVQLKKKENEHQEEKRMVKEETAKLINENSILKTRLDDEDKRR